MTRQFLPHPHLSRYSTPDLPREPSVVMLFVCVVCCVVAVSDSNQFIGIDNNSIFS